jgi:hypothetical protein
MLDMVNEFSGLHRRNNPLHLARSIDGEMRRGVEDHRARDVHGAAGEFNRGHIRPPEQYA